MPDEHVIMMPPAPNESVVWKKLPKTRSQQYKISGNSCNTIMQKQQTKHQQRRSQCPQPAAQHLPILQSHCQQNSLLKSQYAMHQREELKSKTSSLQN